MAFVYFTEQEKEQANSADIASYLKLHGETVKRAGRENVWYAPSGKVSINGSEWYSQYEETGGGAILFVRKFFGLSFPEAVRSLLGDNVGTVVQQKHKEEKVEEKKFEVPPKHTDMRRVYGYLCNERGIARSIVHAFASEGLLFEEPEYHNAVFVGTNNEGVPMHIHKRSTLPGSDFKNNVYGSNADYSFHWNGTSDRLYVFEAPIDMLSYLTLYSSEWEKHSYVALCSTADRGAMRMLKERADLKNVYLCLDHDSAGIEGAYRIAESIRTLDRECNIWRALPVHKDWNEDIKALRGKEAIPSSKHKKMEIYKQNCNEMFAELRETLATIGNGERTIKYKGHAIFDYARAQLDRAAKAVTDNESIKCYNELGKTFIIGYCIRQRQMGVEYTLDDIHKRMMEMYKPHRDYDSVGSLDDQIEKAITELNKKANEKESFSKDEIGVFQNEFLRIAFDCFRQKGTTICEAEALEKKQMIIQ
ncbi:MAG: DUF3991 and TOPRIM domain-containing protein [Clostridia bacterium]|nr:DUF3991 and TOPRIM domain-containing protein [Clostridia bacterium]